jgi:hypothetical protein
MRFPECSLYYGGKFIGYANRTFRLPGEKHVEFAKISKNKLFYLGGEIYIHLQLTPPLSFLPLQLNNNKISNNKFMFTD